MYINLTYPIYLSISIRIPKYIFNRKIIMIFIVFIRMSTLTKRILWKYWKLKNAGKICLCYEKKICKNSQYSSKSLVNIFNYLWLSILTARRPYMIHPNVKYIDRYYSTWIANNYSHLSTDYSFICFITNNILAIRACIFLSI